MNERDDIRTAGEEDAAVERAVLQYVLAAHPTQTSFDELLREIAADPEEFAERDAVERAVRDLVVAGLLRSEGGTVLPSRAALRFDELLNG